ncbi:MAG: hypothetical protein BGO49_30765 [Planctomycetales bacterium 71-10]|nr:MAG: hypothetical protein BGO49_30765 [Planctomycetales bacterium 71-10]
MNQDEWADGEGGAGSLEDLALEAIAAGPPGGSGEDAGPVESLAERAARLRLDVPARLRLFQSACRWVHAGHARGRIFGDLAPARLGATEAGETAEIPAGDESPDALDAWTSPERVLGEPPTTAADVYALGAILYELLADRPPIAVDPADPDAAALAITERAPERPSRAAPADRRRAIGADLDAIVLEALRKEPERRYASAAALADDLDAYLAGLPVRAGRTSEWGRLARFARRRPWAPTALAGAFVAAIAWGAWEAREARSLRRGRERLAVAAGAAGDALAAAVDRLADDAAEDDPATLRREILAGARAYYEGVDDSPARVARIAAVDRALGRKAEAVAGYRDAIDRWKRLAGDRLGDAALAESLADARAGLALALAPGAAGPDADAALESLAAAGETYLALAGREPGEPRHRRRLARVFGRRAEIERKLRRDRPALASARQEVALLEELRLIEPDRAEDRIELASAYGLLGRLLAARDEGAEAPAMALDRAIGLLDGVTGPLKDSPRVAFDAAARLVDLAEVQFADGSIVPATNSLARASKILEDLSAKHPAVASYRGQLAAAYNLDVEMLRGRGRRDEAKARADRARAILERLVVERPDEPRYVAALATSRQLLGRLLAQEGKAAEALKSFRSAADSLEGMKEADRTGADAYALACDLSLGLSLIGVKDGGKPIADADDPALTPADRSRRDLYARRAVEVLRQAVAKGYDAPDLYRRDPALDPLRPREDFKKLLEEILAKGAGNP